MPTGTDSTAYGDPYAITPGYYDLFRANENALPSVSFFADLTPPDADALEIGPGTGRLAVAVAARARSLTCLERSPTMRAVLISKLAQRPDLRPKVTVLDGAAPAFALGRTFDYVYLGGVLEHVPPGDRPELFAAIAAHLKPGGLCAMDMVLRMPSPDQAERVMDEQDLGDCRYILSASAERLGPDLSKLRQTYRTYLRGELIATESVERLHNMHRPEPVLKDLAAAGLHPAEGDGLAQATPLPDDPGAVVVRKAAP
ncbi:class I SAM-dependent methyltransferase [Actinomadura rupiterrae]|uniref:class I SAM-dependent methyltransferase n=1 Tax=Actinomadura rupiterrae TaxID=559627 RepID=UPI0020A5113A|nr:class I SAM-dependent methyltransferase [Actinomadura rupiterrae]MCP2341114.1 SAM-dependent methyltransferase [Actinomadura rupiterrae]